MNPENPTSAPPRYERPDRAGMHEVTRSFEEAQEIYAEVKKLTNEEMRGEMIRRHDRIFKIILAVAFVGIASVVAWYVTSPRQPLPAAPKPIVAPDSTKADEILTAQAQATLVGFFETSEIAARRKFILESDRVGPLMEQYYANGGKDTPAGAKGFNRVPGLTEDDRTRGVLLMTNPTGSKDSKSLVLYLKRVDGSWRMDWEAYIQNKDLVLVDFFNASTHAPIIARAGLRRVHTFGSAVKEALHVVQLEGWEFNTDVFPTPEAAAQINAGLPWSARRRAVVALAWEPDAAGKLRVICKEFKSWDFAP